MNDSAMQERYTALLLTAQNLFSLTSLEDVVDHILRHSLVMMDAEACSMYLPDFATRELVTHSAQGKDNPIHGYRFPWDKGIAGAVFHDHKFLRLDDAQQDSRLWRQADDTGGFVTRTMLCAPLMDKEDCFGVLQALNPVDRPHFTELDEQIFKGLTNIVTGALVRFDRERKIDQQSELAREMELAMEIQKSFLPPEELCLPRAEMRVRYRPARTIGGDFYASIALPGDRLLAALGDVSGKGIPAALTTAQITTEMQALAHLAEGGLAPYVTALNRALCQRLVAGRFAATTFLLYDPRTETMEVICAGQFPPLRQRDDRWEKVEVIGGMALGVLPEQDFQATTFRCLPGEKWLLFSDGINEGQSPTGEEYGTDRLRRSLGEGASPQTLDRAWKAWETFVTRDGQHDDASLALVLIKPEAKLEIMSSACNCKRARHYIEDWALTAGYSDLERGRIVLAADEAVTNIIRHTYKSAPGQPIILSANLAGEHLHLRLRDYGPPVNPEKLHGRPLDDIKPGGLGLHLLKSVFSVVEHDALPDGNEWHLAKPLN